MAEFAPRQVNPNRLLDYCDSLGINPGNHYVLRNILSSQGYSSPNTISTIENENNRPHHITILTTSDLIPGRIQITDAQLLNNLLKQIPTRGALDYLFSQRVTNESGIRKLKALLSSEGLDDKEQRVILKRIYIKPIKPGNIHLAIAEDEGNLEHLESSLGRVSPVVSYRTGLTMDL